MKKETYDVTGMSCAACSSRVEKAVAKQPGAQQVAVNLLKNSMVVEYDESQLSSARLCTQSPAARPPPRRLPRPAAPAPHRRRTAT